MTEIEKKLQEELKEKDQKIREREEYIVKIIQLIRSYDDEILELKAKCQKLTPNEKIAYQMTNKGKMEDIPMEAIKIADYLIDRHMKQASEMSVHPEDYDDMRKMQIECLREIAEHLLVFCGGRE